MTHSAYGLGWVAQEQQRRRGSPRATGCPCRRKLVELQHQFKQAQGSNAKALSAFKGSRCRPREVAWTRMLITSTKKTDPIENKNEKSATPGHSNLDRGPKFAPQKVPARPEQVECSKRGCGS